MTTSNFSDYLQQFDGDLQRLGNLMHEHLGAEVALIAEMETREYLTGGKRLRAIVTLLAAKLCRAAPAQADQVAIAVEFIHTATLLHDDVVDEAPMRRHLPAAARVYGNAAAVLAGDFLYSRASQLLAQLDNLALLQRMADVTNRLAEGELLQLLNRGKSDVDEATYYSIIERKTANLFSVAAAAAALLTHQDDGALSVYGQELGIAFQLVDDCLDYEGEDALLGKAVGADFSEGKMTLPIIVMFSRIAREKQQQLREGWEAGDADSFSQTVALLHETEALTAVRRVAQQHAEKAVAALAPCAAGDIKTALIELAQESVRRNK